MKNVLKTLVVVGGLLVGSTALANTCAQYNQKKVNFERWLATQCSPGNYVGMIKERKKLINNCAKFCPASACLQTRDQANRDLNWAANTCKAQYKRRAARWGGAEVSWPGTETGTTPAPTDPSAQKPGAGAPPAGGGGAPGAPGDTGSPAPGVGGGGDSPCGPAGC